MVVVDDEVGLEGVASIVFSAGLGVEVVVDVELLTSWEAVISAAADSAAVGIISCEVV
jgi:hypothetical protein